VELSHLDLISRIQTMKNGPPTSSHQDNLDTLSLQLNSVQQFPLFFSSLKEFWIMKTLGNVTLVERFWASSIDFILSTIFENKFNHMENFNFKFN